MSLPIPVNIAQSKHTTKPGVYTMGKKHYESVDWLGNVRVTYTDKKSWQQNKFALNVSSSQDYYPFGSVMEGRDFEITNYRFGFNAMEKDDEIMGNGNSYDFSNRIYDSRLGRWLITDAYASKYPSLSPYNFGANNPITNIDIAGDSIWVTIKTQQIGDKIIITRTIHTTIAVLNTSDDVHDMEKVTEAIRAGLVNSLTMYDVGGAGPNAVINYRADVQVRAVTDMGQVDPTEHLMVIVDDVTYDEGLFSNTVGVAIMYGQIAYIETTSLLNDRDFDDMIRTAIHEWGHNAGLGHQFDDPKNYMSYSLQEMNFLQIS